MRLLSLLVVLVFVSQHTLGQNATRKDEKEEPSGKSNNIYKIREQFLNSLKETDREPNKQNGGDDELAEFNRWYYMTELRSYPSGELPPADAQLKAYQEENNNKKQNFKLTGNPGPWQLIGPTVVPNYWSGIGRVNCISIVPQSPGTIYVGAACGGVWKSTDSGQTWTSNSDNFPSMSVADIAINPVHTDTVYAATGDGYGYEVDGYQIFWGGLYTAGILKSTDGGATWDTTGFNSVQTDKNLIKHLLIHPIQTNILLASTRNGIFRTTDAGATWTNVHAGNIFKMIFSPQSADTIYASQSNAFLASYDKGATWQVLSNGVQNRVNIAVSPAAPNNVWIIDSVGALYKSVDFGQSFNAIGTPTGLNFQGYYDLAVAVSPLDTNNISVLGVNMARSFNEGSTWQTLGNYNVHSDNRVLTYAPGNPSKFYIGNDGGIFMTPDNGSSWNNLSSGLTISQIYRTASSRQNPYMILCGLQDNSTIMYDGTNWSSVVGGDGEACAISPTSDFIQIASYQEGNFYLSTSQGNYFQPLNLPGFGYAAWTAPVVINPNDPDSVYFGLFGVFQLSSASSVVNLTPTDSFTDGTQKHPGVTELVIAPSNTRVLYAANEGRIMRTTDAGATWTNVTGNLPVNQVAICRMAVDFNNANRVYVTMSGYQAGQKVFVSDIGGTTWNNISYNLPNLPTDCIAVDSTSNGALFVGTDMGIYYIDSTQTTWTKYSTGLPNVIVDDIDINYTNYKIRAATYGRGLWECDLPRKNLGIHQMQYTTPALQLSPNPASSSWNINFTKNRPANYTITVTDITGKVVTQQQNIDKINILSYAAGVYIVDIAADNMHYHIKAIKE